MARAINLTGRGMRGESQADILRRTGLFGVLPTDDDATAVSKLNADAAQSAAFAEEFSGPAYDTVELGEAATTAGQFFRVPVPDTDPREYTRYQRTAGGSVEAAPLATTLALASTDSGKGAAMVGKKRQGVGAIDETVGTMLDRLPFWPESFGAAGDYDPDTGEGTDDTEAIRKAIAAAAANAPALVVLTQRYKVTGIISGAGAEGVTLAWVGKAAHIYAYLGDDSPGPAIWGVSRFNVENGRATVFSTLSPDNGTQALVHAPFGYGALIGDSENTVASPSPHYNAGYFSCSIAHAESDKSVEVTGQASYTASISGTTMTVTAVASGALFPEDLVRGSGVHADTKIVQQLTTTEGDGSNNGTGTYEVSVSQSLSSRAMTGSYLNGTYGIQINGCHDFEIPFIHVPDSEWMLGPISCDYDEIGGIVSTDTAAAMNANKAKWDAGTAYTLPTRNGRVGLMTFGDLTVPAGGRQDVGSGGPRMSGCVNVVYGPCVGGQVTNRGLAFTAGDPGDEFTHPDWRGLLTKGCRFGPVTIRKPGGLRAAESDTYADNVARAVLDGYTAMTDTTLATDVVFEGLTIAGDSKSLSGFRFGDQIGGLARNLNISDFPNPVYVTDGADGLTIELPRPIGSGASDGIFIDGPTTPPKNITIARPVAAGNGDGSGDFAGVHFGRCEDCTLMLGTFGSPGEALQKFAYRVGSTAVRTTIIAPTVLGYAAGGGEGFIQRNDALIVSRIPGAGSNVIRTLAQSGTASAALTGTTTETTLATVTIPAGSMGANGSLDIELLAKIADTSGSTKLIRVKLGGSTLYTTGGTTDPSFQSKVRIYNAGAENSQKSQAGNFGYGTTGSGVGTASIDTSVDTTLTITGQLGNAADSLTLEAYTVDLRPRA